MLNFLFFNNKLYGKVSAIDPTLYKYCVKNDIEIVNINQGYARCSTLILNNRTAVTADISIKNALEKNGAEVLLISSGDIKLEEYDYGFIGGASGKISDNTVVFFGNAEMRERLAAFGIKPVIGDGVPRPLQRGGGALAIEGKNAVVRDDRRCLRVDGPGDERAKFVQQAVPDQYVIFPRGGDVNGVQCPSTSSLRRRPTSWGTTLPCAFRARR